MERAEQKGKRKDAKGIDSGIDKTTRRIIRLLATDIDGDLSVINAMRRIKGVNFMFANAVCNIMGIDRKKKIGEMSPDEIKNIENFIKKPEIPVWLLNRRNDRETGENIHITKVDIDLKKREDINLLRRIRAYKGIRHEQGHPVRGQKTRGSFRSQKAVGVVKKSARAAKAAAAKK